MSSPAEILISFVPRVMARRAAEALEPLTAPIKDESAAAMLFADVSGFTALSARLTEHGLAGAEMLTRLLNDYFGRIIDLITGYGGDVMKFAGDALLASWPATDDADTLSQATLRTARCGLAIQDVLKDYSADGIRLTLRISVGAGQAIGMHLGGVRGRQEYLLSGAAVLQATAADAVARPGEVLLSPEAVTLIADRCHGQALETGHLRLQRLDADLEPAMTRALVLSAAAEAALHRYIPYSIRSKLAAGHSDWLAELRPLTVLFISLPGIPQQTSLEEAQELFCTLQTELYRYEASINKLSADNKGTMLVAALGLPPLAHENDPIRGVRAAVAVRARLQEMGWGCAIGVTTGRAFCGVVGNDQRREYTIMGDVVNMSARLMQHAQEGVLCDETTYRAARSDLDFETLPPVFVKGKAERVPVYQPGSAKPLRSLKRAELAMVGRHAERAQLQDCLDALLRGESGIVVIEGEPGIGKSRLASAVQEIATSLGIRCLTGTGDAIEAQRPYHAWRGVYGRLLGLDDVSEPEARRAGVFRHLAAFPELLPLAPLLNDVLPLELPENEMTAALVGPARAQLTMQLLLPLLQGATAQTPILLTLEDAHWMDSASLAVALQVAERVRPLLLLLITRPNEDPAAQGHERLLEMQGALHLSLASLPEDDVSALVCDRLGVTALPPAVGELIRRKAEGNPLFSEELAYAMRDSGLIGLSDGECRLICTEEELRLLDFPDSVQGIITSRIDGLNSAEQLTLKVASVIGRSFAFRTLYDIHPIDSDRQLLPQLLDVLSLRDLTPIETPPPDLSYLFKHIITQEVAYNMLLFAQRRQLHGKIAAWYEQTRTEDLSLFYPLLAHHWSKAEVAAKAVFYQQKAGQQAARSNANREAENYFTHAREWLQTLPETPDRAYQELALLLDLGPVLLITRGQGAEEAKQTYDRAYAMCQELAETPQMAGSLFGLWAYYLFRADLPTARRLAEQCLNLANTIGDPDLRLQSHLALGNTLYWLGEGEAAMPHVEQVLQLYDPARHHVYIARYAQNPRITCMTFGSFALWAQGYPDTALARGQETLALAQELSHPYSVALALQIVALVHQFRREVDQTRRQSEALIALSTQYGFPPYLWLGRLLSAWVQAQEGEPQEAVAKLREGIAAWSELGVDLVRSYYALLLADAQILAGQEDEALGTVNDALRWANISQERVFVAELVRVKGTLLLVSPSAAEACFIQARDIAREQGAKMLELRATVSLSGLWLQQGRREQARNDLAAIYNGFREGFALADLREAAELLAELH